MIIYTHGKEKSVSYQSNGVCNFLAVRTYHLVRSKGVKVRGTRFTNGGVDQ